MSQDYIEVKECSICGCQSFTTRDVRSDGIAVIECNNCSMGTVARYPHDLSALYTEEYYAGIESRDSNTHGYTDYQEVATHSLSWVVQLVKLLCPSGRVLDVGCANGYVLKLLGQEYACYGIEVSESMIAECFELGIKIIGRDITNKVELVQYHKMFDVITGIAVLEHVNDLKSALNNIKELLLDRGVFIFEVPLMSNIHDNAIWLKSSLEHIYYPTIAGLHYVFNEIFDLPLIGHEVSIHDYGSLFVGIVTLNRQRHTELEQLHQRLFGGSVSDLMTDEERVLRFLFDVVHSAQTTPATVSLLKNVPPEMVTTPLLLRLSQIWHQDTSRRDELAARALTLEQQLHETAIAYQDQRNWIQSQAENYMAELENWKQIAEQRAYWITQLEQARDYYSQQARNWQAATVERDSLVQERDSLVQERDSLVQERNELLNEGVLLHIKRQIKSHRKTKTRTRPRIE